MPDVSTDPRPVILTGDRPTGPLHLGHYCGKLRNRVALRCDHDQFVLITDERPLIDNADYPGGIMRHVLDLAHDDPAVAGKFSVAGALALTSLRRHKGFLHVGWHVVSPKPLRGSR